MIQYLDINIFLYGEHDIRKTINDIILFLYNNLKVLSIYHNDSFITIKVKEEKIKIVKRLYSCFQEILLKFDLDSCVVGLTRLNDNINIYYSNRYRLDVEYRINTIDLFRQSRSYNTRLYKSIYF